MAKLDTRPKYASETQRDALRATMRKESLTTNQLAYDLRVHPTHLAGMLGGSKNMAHHFLLSIKFILLVRRQERIKSEMSR